MSILVAPNATVYPEIQRVIVLGKTIINCTVTGNPRATISWVISDQLTYGSSSKDDNTKECPITALAEECISTDTLIIDHTLPYHAGKYACIGRGTSLAEKSRAVSKLRVESMYVCIDTYTVTIIND